MTDRLQPRDDTEVEAAVQWALAETKALEVVGQGSKRAIGRPAQTEVTLDLSTLCGVTLYEPEELVLSAKAGTPIATIEALLASQNQELAFEPMDYGPVLTAQPGAGTIGGVLAANLSGPRRIKAGAARDHFLGFSAVSGRGERFKSGGRVVKNVTGYDLCKLMAGSWGTLAILTDVTVKVLPRAETEQTLLVLGLDDAAAVKAMAAAMGSSGDVSGAAHLPRTTAALIQGSIGAAGSSLTALRLEGVPPSIVHRRATLENLLKSLGPLGTLAEQESRAFWRAVRDVTPFAPAAASSPTHALWRLSTPPSEGPAIAHRIMGEIGGEVFYDWAGGLLWLRVGSGDDGGAAAIRRALGENGSHATLVRAPASLRAAIDVFEPQTPEIAALTRRVKQGFDPHGILNPGRMYAGI